MGRVPSLGIRWLLQTALSGSQPRHARPPAGRQKPARQREARERRGIFSGESCIQSASQWFKARLRLCAAKIVWRLRSKGARGSWTHDRREDFSAAAHLCPGRRCVGCGACRMRRPEARHTGNRQSDDSNGVEIIIRCASSRGWQPASQRLPDRSRARPRLAPPARCG